VTTTITAAITLISRLPSDDLIRSLLTVKEDLGTYNSIVSNTSERFWIEAIQIFPDQQRLLAFVSFIIMLLLALPRPPDFLFHVFVVVRLFLLNQLGSLLFPCSGKRLCGKDARVSA
jgi:hypothetical protein